MIRLLSVCAVSLAMRATVFAQPAIGQNGVVNAASRIPPSLPGGSIGRGALFTITGVRLEEAGRASVTIEKNGQTAQAVILKASERRIDAWMPMAAPLGSVSMIVTAGGKTSKPFPLEVSESNPGLFSRNGDGWGPAVADNIAPSGARSPNLPSRPVHAGRMVTLSATGLGTTRDITVIVGDKPVKAEALRRGEESGKEEIRVTIPADAPQGCWVPVYLLITPTRASNVVTLSIGAGFMPCLAGLLPADPPQRIGVVGLSRTQVKSIGKTARPNDKGAILDDARISFVAVSKNTGLTPLRALPPPGSCTAYSTSFQSNPDLASSFTSIVSPDGRGLDAGSPLILSRTDQSASPSEARSIGEGVETPGHYRSRLGSSWRPNGKAAAPRFLLPGGYLIRGPGGKNIGPFTARFTLSPALNWTDRDQISAVDRSRGVTVHWNQAPAEGLVLIVARNVDQVATSIGMSICAAPPALGQFAIPPAMLANIPPSADLPGASYDELAVGALALRSPIKASGIEVGWVMSVDLSERFVQFR